MDGFPVNITEAEAPHFIIDGKLQDILKVTPGACLQYAVIEGAVQPAGEPLTSHFQKEFVGVLQKFLLREHRLVWNSLSRTWTDSERVLHHRVSEVPFVLVGSNETTVRVLCPLQASGLHMETTHEKFHQVNYGLGDIIGQYLSGEKLKGQLETEEMLKVGTTLTGVGELMLDVDGTLNLRPPSNGSQYFLSITDFDTLLGEQQSAALWWKALAVGSALVGAAVLAWVGRRYYSHLKVRWEREQERREFERLQADGSRAAGRDTPQAATHPRDHRETTERPQQHLHLRRQSKSSCAPRGSRQETNNKQPLQRERKKRENTALLRT
uniref:RING-type E3 ubiquitin transferase n=1 Tax=Gasterosteus aculeatus aculeatus TaxID=481459 RepID=A0AAQ4QIN8_GASAC